MAWHEGATGWTSLGTMPLFAGAAPSPAPFPPPAARAGGNRTLLWVFGGCGGLLLLGLLGFIALAIIGSRLPKDAAARVAATPDAAVRPGGGTMQNYTNTREALPASLQAKFVAFRFDYPEGWTLLPHDEDNFVKVERFGAKGSGDTVENFAVGYITVKPASGSDEALMPVILDLFRKQISAGFPKFQELAVQDAKVGGVPGRQLVFQAEYEGKPLFGKVIVAHRQGQEHGVAIILLATSQATAYAAASDLGQKGNTAAILRSFQLP